MILLIKEFLEAKEGTDTEEFPIGWYLDHPTRVWREEQYSDGGPDGVYNFEEIEPDFKKLQELGVRGYAVLVDDMGPSVFRLHLRDEGLVREEVPLEYEIANVVWRLSFGIPVDIEDVLELSDELYEILKDEGMEDESSGAGFGFRDMQFVTEDEEMARRAKQIAETFMKERVKDTEEDPYVSLVKQMQVYEKVE